MFALDSTVVEVQEMFSSHGGHLTNAMYQARFVFLPEPNSFERPGLEVIKVEFILGLKIKRNDWLLADTCLQAANHCALF